MTMTTATRYYYRIESADLDHERLLHPDHQTSRVWAGTVWIPCADCRGGEWTDCEACGGNGGHDVWHQDGVSCCRTMDDLIDYLRDRWARLDGQVVVEMEGVERDEADVDEDEGAVLITPTRIVSVTPLDPTVVTVDNPIYEED